MTHEFDPAGGREPADNTEKPSVWSRVKGALIRTEQEFAFLKGLTIVSVLGTILVGYFQYISAYEDKVAAQYKEDFTAATAAFNEIANDFSTAQNLQQLLYFNYNDVAGKDDEKILTTVQAKSAHDLYKNYSAARVALRENIDILARKVEMQIDWASDRQRDPAKPRDINADPLTRAKLGEYNFNCDAPDNMPHFPRQNPQTAEEKAIKPYVDLHALDKHQRVIAGKPTIRINWFSAMHHVWTMYYCFNGTHEALLAAREWAAESPVDPKHRADFLARRDAIREALDSQVLRLQAFMSVSMWRIETIRVKYRPNGFICHVPIARELVDLLPSARCSPIRTSVD